MESFKGNGAECMVRFIANGCRGEIMRDGESVIKAGRENGSIWSVDGTSWLYAMCTYRPPAPVWRNATPGEALDAWFRGKAVQRRADTLDDAIADGEWYDIGPRYSDMPFSRWSVQETKYRIKEE